mmetsp:Transcript_39738/g.93321  ORF Transcript_39738/g.93321 Transcript_39738/m.93321 type:complete len:200 (-) Transcript_39738:687-1286(-)
MSPPHPTPRSSSPPLTMTRTWTTWHRNSWCTTALVLSTLSLRPCMRSYRAKHSTSSCPLLSWPLCWRASHRYRWRTGVVTPRRTSAPPNHLSRGSGSLWKSLQRTPGARYSSLQLGCPDHLLVASAPLAATSELLRIDAITHTSPSQPPAPFRLRSPGMRARNSLPSELARLWSSQQKVDLDLLEFHGNGETNIQFTFE